MCFPSFGFAEIHPDLALLNERRISPSADGDQRSARWIGGRFLKKATQKLFTFDLCQILFFSLSKTALFAAIFISIAAVLATADAPDEPRVFITGFLQPSIMPPPRELKS